MTYKKTLDDLFIWLHGDICRMDELLKAIALDPTRFIRDGTQWLNEKVISCRICPECLADLVTDGLDFDHIGKMKCPECGRKFEYF